MSSVGKIGSEAYNIGKEYFLAKSGMSSEFIKYFPSHIKTLKTIDKYSGEAFNIGINAIGTAAVAPIFIAYNPLSKTDEETKKYSALRQPISAILAVVTQAGLVIPWDRLVDKWTNTGKLGQYYSQQAFQDAKFLYRQAKKAHPNWSKDELNRHVKMQQADQYAKIYEEFISNGSISVGGKKLPESELRKLISEVANEKIKKTNSTIDRYKIGGEKYTNKVARAEFLLENSDTILKKLDIINTDIASKSPKDIQSYLKKLIKEAKANGSHKEYIKILEEDFLPKGNVQSIQKQIKHIKTKVQYYREIGSLNKIIAAISTDLNNSDEVMRAQREHFKAIKELADKGEPISKLMSLIKKENITFYTKDIELENIRVAVVDKYIDKIGKRIKGTKAISGLVLSLAIMPFTCCALNYIYPRFMDKFFPELAKAKKEGGKK